MTERLPPPTYSQENPDGGRSSPAGSSTFSTTPQILLVPTADAINFQKGHLGAENERAAIEGELQIKGADPGTWGKVTIQLQTIEVAHGHEIELGCSQVVLWARRPELEAGVMPSSFLFAIPLMPDTPQSIQTSHSSLSHLLTATLYPINPAAISISKALIVHTRRYTSHSHSLALSPSIHSIDDPTRVEVELPRVNFKADEPIPIYVTIPSPRRELVVDQGLRLRNVRAELIRTVKVKTGFQEEGEEWRDEDSFDNGDDEVQLGDEEDEQGPSTSSDGSNLTSPLFFGSSYRSIIARSGASCRFHSSRAVQLRFLLHQQASSSPPSSLAPDLASGELDSDSDCASISQTTLLHTVAFRIAVHISFVDVTTRTEKISVISIPITMVAPSAPLPEVPQNFDAAYQKKHDRPPARTVRYEEGEFCAPYYQEGEAGPSAPPPFEDRDAPPPFFSHFSEASTSARLPTFLESETEVLIVEDHASTHQVPTSPSIAGEGVAFGFSAAEQFDGHSEILSTSSTPPPSLEMANRDTNLTSLAEIEEPDLAIEALGLVLDQHEDAVRRELPPPPPPAMDDPEDPPPSIDSHFRSPDMPRSTPPRSPPPLPPTFSAEPPPTLHRLPSPPPLEAPSTHNHAPPPYLIPDVSGDVEHVNRPPPYVD